jgi:hypothetical protein
MIVVSTLPRVMMLEEGTFYGVPTAHLLQRVLQSLNQLLFFGIGRFCIGMQR